MSIDDVIDCMVVIVYYNPNMVNLHNKFVEQASSVSDLADEINTAFADGRPVYETLITLNVELANAIHDYIYNIIRPFDSVMVKNTIREQMARDLFGIEAYF